MITLDQARAHLRIDGTQDDTEISLKLNLAQELVSRYIGNMRSNPYEYINDDEVCPPGTATPEELEGYRTYYWDREPKGGIDVAVLMVLGDLWLNRESTTGDPLSPSVRNVLSLYRELPYA